MTLPTTILALVVLVALSYLVLRLLGVESPRTQPWAIARAVLQLGILSVILGGVITSTVWVAVFLVVMVVAATWTVMRRLRLPALWAFPVAATLVVAAAVPVGIVFGTGALEPSARYLLAISGIVIGGAMTVATLMGRGVAAAYLSQRDEIEGWLALGATPRRAALRAVRQAASTALIPATDQAKTAGLVTLPGAFVGAIFGGASPLDAAQFQVVVLAAVLAAGASSVACLFWLLGAPKQLPLS